MNVIDGTIYNQNIPRVLTINGKFLDEDISLDLAELFPPEVLGAKNQINVTSWTCKHCNKIANSISGYAKHLKSHYKARRKDEHKIECDICCKKVVQMHRHLQKHTGEFTCRMCLTIYSRKNDLLNHQKTCKDGDETILQCVICKLIVQTRNELREHLIMNHSVAPNRRIDGVFNYINYNNAEIFPCTFCKRSYSKRYLLSQHVRTKHNVYGLNADEECLICHVKFNSVRTALRHMQIHNKGKLIKCTHCDKSFVSESMLKQHNLKHNKSSYSCPYCDSVVKYPQSLKRHIIKAHNNKVPELVYLNFEQCKTNLPLKKYKKTKHDKKKVNQPKELLPLFDDSQAHLDTNILINEDFIYDENLLNLSIDYPIELLSADDLSQLDVSSTILNSDCDFYVDTMTGQLISFEKT